MAIRLNSGGGNDGFCTYSTSEPTVGQTNNYTVAAWVYADVLDGTTEKWWSICSIDDGSDDWCVIQLYRDVNSNIAAEFNINPHGGTAIARATEPFDTGSWYYVVGQYDYNGGARNARYGGAISPATALDEWITSAQQVGDATLTEAQVTLKVGSSGWNEYFNGRVAHCRLWTAALTQTEIEAEMVSTTAVRTSGLWSAWEFDGNANDSSGNGRNLSVTGSVSYVAGPLTAGGIIPVKLSHIRRRRT